MRAKSETRIANALFGVIVVLMMVTLAASVRRLVAHNAAVEGVQTAEELKNGQGITICAVGPIKDERLTIRMVQAPDGEWTRLNLERRGDAWCIEVPRMQIPLLRAVHFSTQAGDAHQLWISTIPSPRTKLAELEFRSGRTDSVFFTEDRGPQIINLDEALTRQAD